MAKSKRGLMQLIEDGWHATFSGLGGTRDKGRASNIAFRGLCTLDRQTLADAYRNLWLVRRYIDAMPECALRHGYGFDEADAPEFVRLNTSVHREGAFERALCQARLMGGAGIYIGYRNGGADLLQPAQPGAQVEFLEVFDSKSLTGDARERDASLATFEQPQVWTVTGAARRAGLRFHTSRMIRFGGEPRAEDSSISQQDRDWDDSVCQAVWEDLQRYGVFWQSVSHLMQVSSVGVLKLAGLIELLASQNQSVAEARVDLISEGLSITRMLLLDAKHDESYERQAVSFTDVPKLIETLQGTIAGALNMPQTELWGRAPAGLSATGESDTRSWYDRVEAYRESQVARSLIELVRITDGKEIEVDFQPLWSPTEQEREEARQTRVNTDERLWSMGIASDAELRRAYYEKKPIEELLSGKPPAEPTRPVTMIQAIDPSANPAKPEDPKAPDGEPKPKAAPVFDAAPVVHVHVQPAATPAPVAPPTAAEVADELERRHPPTD